MPDEFDDFVETEDDRAAFFSDGEFATPAQWVTTAGAATELRGIFNKPWLDEAGLASVDMTTAMPSFVCRASDVPSGAQQGDQIFTEGAWYSARELRPDETGIVTIDLQKV